MTDESQVYDEGYPSRRLLELIGDKWTPIIVYILGQGTKRYGELRRHLPDVSKIKVVETQACVDLLFQELKRVKSSNTTRRYLTHIIKVLAAMPSELVL